MACSHSVLFLMTGCMAIGALSAACNVNTTIAQSANASGVFDFQVDLVPQQLAPNSSVIAPVLTPSWAYTVNASTENSSVAQIWYSAGTDNDSNNVSLAFGACAYLVLSHIPGNTIDLGRNDPGDCSSMLSTSCRGAILNRTLASANSLTRPLEPPSSNSTSLAVACKQILTTLGESSGLTWPKECAKDFGYNHRGSHGRRDVLTYETPLLGYNASDTTGNCTLQTGNQTYYNIPSTYVGSTIYDRDARNIIPALTVYFPLANASGAQSVLRCLRVTDYRPGSVVALLLPPGKPYSNGLSKGAIAGIVIGAIAGLCIVLARPMCIAVSYCRRRKRH